MNLSEPAELCIFYILHWCISIELRRAGTICNSEYIVLSIQDLGNGRSAFYGYFMLCINHGKNVIPVCSTFRHFILLWFNSFFCPFKEYLKNIPEYAFIGTRYTWGLKESHGLMVSCVPNWPIAMMLLKYWPWQERHLCPYTSTDQSFW